jgi:murein DD-endopeptidase MepM/ murein hydrolase activator NlpD
MKKLHLFNKDILVRVAVLILALFYIGGTSIVYAQEDTPYDGSGFTEQDLEDINNQVPWYGPSLEGCTIDAPAASLTGNNIKDAFLYFITHTTNGKPDGLTAIQSAGIVGNLIQESGVNPRSNQAGGPGMGIAQWSEGGRWESLKKWVAENNKGDIYSLGAQLDFLWHEMVDVAPWNQTLPAIRNDTTVEAATTTFEEKFEKAGIPNMPRRIQNAKNVLKEYGNLAPASAGSTTVETGTTREDGEGLCGGGDISESDVNAQGYAWPVEDKKKHGYSGIPCKKRTCHHDGTAAADLMYGSNAEMSGRDVYAITDGTISKQGTYRGVQGCYSIQFKSDLTNGKPNGNYYYWYGHLQNPKFSTGDKPKGGQQIAEVARTGLGPVCHGRQPSAEPGPHLHIDRGCTQGGIPQTGGGKSCRDAAFIVILNKLWEELPE